MARLFSTICGVLLFSLACAGCQTGDSVGPGREDVQEVSETPLPEGPADPDPACSPDNPYC